MNVVLIAGSPCIPSRSSVLLEQVHKRLLSAGAHCDEIVLRELPPKALVQADVEDPLLQTALQRVEQADVVVVSTPIYKAAYSGLLKIFLDLLPQDGLRAKSVLALATGGTVAHLLAIDYTLKPVLHALGARHIADAVFVSDAQLMRNLSGSYELESALIERIDRALAGLFEPPAPKRFFKSSAPGLLTVASC